MNRPSVIAEPPVSNACDSPAGAPTWFRYAVIAMATVILCSCRSNNTSTRPQAHYSIGQSNAPAPLNVQPAAQRPSDAGMVQQVQYQAPPQAVPAMYPTPTISSAIPVEGCPTGNCSCQSCPIRGPNDEYLCDGGDYGVPAGVRVDRHVQGLEQEDTIAHYDTVDGRTVVTPSNKVCIYAPRFAAVRRVIDVHAYSQSTTTGGMLQEAAPVKAEDLGVATVSLAELGPIINRAGRPASLLVDRLMPGELDRDQAVLVDVGAVAPVSDLQLIATGEVIGSEGPEIARSSLAAVTWAGDQAPQIVLENEHAKAEVSVLSPGTVYHLKEPNSPRLRLVKLASTGAALPGEEVEFTLRFDNVGDREIKNVTIVDNLTTRLEYVADSQKSSVDAQFVTDPNDGGSLVLKWQLIEPLKPREGGVITFRCKVR